MTREFNRAQVCLLQVFKQGVLPGSVGRTGSKADESCVIPPLSVNLGFSVQPENLGVAWGEQKPARVKVSPTAGSDPSLI